MLVVLINTHNLKNVDDVTCIRLLPRVPIVLIGRSAISTNVYNVRVHMTYCSTCTCIMYGRSLSGQYNNTDGTYVRILCTFVVVGHARHDTTSRMVGAYGFVIGSLVNNLSLVDDSS